MYITSRKARQEIKMGVSETKIMYFFGWLKVSSLVDDVVVASEWGFLFCEARRVEESGMDSFSFRFIADPVGDFFRVMLALTHSLSLWLVCGSFFGSESKLSCPEGENGGKNQ
jgi:hypothetical protein